MISRLNEPMKPFRKGFILLGAHMSNAGGVHKAIERGARIGCTTIQLFVKNNVQWTAKPLEESVVASYKKLLSESNINPVVVHATYLINLCAKDRAMLRRSRAALKDEFDRAERLGAEYLNLHPGAHRGRGERDGIKLIAESLNIIHEQTKGYRVKTVLETTAGQGTALGYRFEQLQQMIERIEEKERMAVCVDTCHVFAAGYDISTESGYERTFRDFEQIIGLDRLAVIHVNDSRRECGARVDRHAHIGQGRIGTEGFRLLMNDPRLANIPKILETPKGPDLHEDVENMRLLRSLIRR